MHSLPRKQVATERPKIVVTSAVIEAVNEACAAEESDWDDVRKGELNRSPMFTFVKTIRESVAFWGLNAKAALRLVEEALKAEGSSLEGMGLHDDPAIAFLAVWPKVIPVGTFERAVQLAKEYPVEIEDAPSLAYTEFCSLCASLQWLSPSGPFLISTERFGEVLNVSSRAVAYHRVFAIQEGLLEVVEPGDWAGHRAGKFRWRGPVRPFP